MTPPPYSSDNSGDPPPCYEEEDSKKPLPSQEEVEAILSLIPGYEHIGLNPGEV